MREVVLCSPWMSAQEAFPKARSIVENQAMGNIDAVSANSRTACPISRVEVIPLAVPDADRSDLDGLVETVIVKVHDEAGRYGFGETDAPPGVIKAFIESPTAHACAPILLRSNTPVVTTSTGSPDAASCAAMPKIAPTNTPAPDMIAAGAVSGMVLPG